MNFSKQGTKNESGIKNGRSFGIIPAACLHRNRGMLWIGASLAIVVASSFLSARTAGPLDLLAPVAQAQSFGQRAIQGKVVDDTGTPVQGATVFLKNDKTRNVKSFTSAADGGFRFAQVGMVDDYDVWAEHASRKSPVKTISSFDARKQVDFDLKLK